MSRSTFTSMNRERLTSRYSVAGLISVAAVAVGGFLGTGAGVGAAQSKAKPTLKRETVYLDSYEKKTKTAGPVRTKRKLARGTTYLVTAQGTFSYYDPEALRGAKYCGKPEAAPRRRSKGRKNGPVFGDVETIFALPRGNLKPGDCEVLPFHWTAFQMSAGGKYRHLEAIGGRTNVPSSGHRYRYLLKGRGQVARFQLRDDFPGDNYGVVTIKLRKATKTEIAAGKKAPATPAPTTPAPTLPTP